MKHYIKQLLRESLLNEDDDIKQSIINLLKSGDERNIELAYALGEGQKINVDELVISIYGDILLNKAKGGTIKDKVLYLTNLKYLLLDNNQLTTLKGIENLTNLEYLYLDNNELTSLPEGISNLTNLVWLDLEDNKLTNLEGIENLTNLKRLDLHNNNITNLPEGIDKLTNLKELYLYNNPISGSEKARLKKIFGNKVIF